MPPGETQPDLGIDWQELTEYATSLLCEYIRINTTNPPGGEEAGAVFLRDALAKEGISSQLHDAGDSRVSISARLEGSGSAKPIVLLSHIDVVPVEPEHWHVDPFSGDIVEDVIWGRGALDMKGMAVMELMAMVLAKRHRIRLERDIVFLAVADEEAGGMKGIHHICETAPHLLDAEYIFNEGAYGFSEFMGRQTKMFGVAPSEKSPCWVKLVATGQPGHASVPHGDNAVAKLVKALGRVEAHERRARLTPAVEAMLSTLKTNGFMPEELNPGDPQTLETLSSVDAHLGAITHDTVNLTGFRAGKKHNVIPGTAEATLDCRLLPDTKPDDFVAELSEIIDDPGVKVERVLEHYSGASSLDTPVVSVIGEVLKEMYGEEAILLPQLCPAFTDSHAYRKAGGQAYGFTPSLLTREDLATIHGHNERLSIANLRMGANVLFEVTRRLACRG